VLSSARAKPLPLGTRYVTGYLLQTAISSYTQIAIAWLYARPAGLKPSAHSTKPAYAVYPIHFPTFITRSLIQPTKVGFVEIAEGFSPAEYIHPIVSTNTENR